MVAGNKKCLKLTLDSELSLLIHFLLRNEQCNVYLSGLPFACDSTSSTSSIYILKVPCSRAPVLQMQIPKRTDIQIHRARSYE